MHVITRAGMMENLSKQVIELVAEAGEPGLTEPALAAASSAGGDVSTVCERLMANGELVRRGSGTHEEPYTYHLPDGGVPRL